VCTADFTAEFHDVIYKSRDTPTQTHNAGLRRRYRRRLTERKQSTHFNMILVPLDSSDVCVLKWGFTNYWE